MAFCEDGPATSDTACPTRRSATCTSSPGCAWSSGFAANIVVPTVIPPSCTKIEASGRGGREHPSGGQRAGRPPRMATATDASEVELRGPELRKGQFHPSILDPGGETNQARHLPSR